MVRSVQTIGIIIIHFSFNYSPPIAKCLVYSILTYSTRVHMYNVIYNMYIITLYTLIFSSFIHFTSIRVNHFLCILCILK